MNQNITIRLAEEKDYEEVMALYRESYALHTAALPDHYDLPTPKYPFRRGTYLNILEDEKEQLYVAEADQQIIGVINFSIEEVEASNYSSAYQRVSVDELMITEPYRRQGVGHMLMAKAEEWAKEKKIPEITVIVYSFNTQAISFYEAEGYGQYSLRLLKNVKASGQE